MKRIASGAVSGAALGAVSSVVATCLAIVPGSVGPAVQTAGAIHGDTHIVGVSLTETIDCSGGTLFVNGVNNVIHAMGVCWAVTTQGAKNTIIAETIVNDITVYGSDQTVFYHNGDPLMFDRGREMGMTNRMARVPA